MAIDLVEVFSVTTQHHLYVRRKVDTRTAHLHKSYLHIAYTRLFAEVDGHVHSRLATESLPATVVIGPSATLSVDERRLSASRIRLVIRFVVNHLCAYRLALHRAQRLRSLPYLTSQIEGVHALHIAQTVCLHQSTTLELAVVFRLRAVPANLHECERTRPQHLLHVLRGLHMLRPEVALNTRYKLALCLGQVFTGYIAVDFL